MSEQNIDQIIQDNREELEKQAKIIVGVLPLIINAFTYGIDPDVYDDDHVIWTQFAAAKLLADSTAKTISSFEFNTRRVRDLDLRKLYDREHQGVHIIGRTPNGLIHVNALGGLVDAKSPLQIGGKKRNDFSDSANRVASKPLEVNAHVFEEGQKVLDFWFVAMDRRTEFSNMDIAGERVQVRPPPEIQGQTQEVYIKPLRQAVSSIALIVPSFK